MCLDTHVGHVSDMTQLNNKSVCPALKKKNTKWKKIRERNEQPGSCSFKPQNILHMLRSGSYLLVDQFPLVLKYLSAHLKVGPSYIIIHEKKKVVMSQSQLVNLSSTNLHSTSIFYLYNTKTKSILHNLLVKDNKSRTMVNLRLQGCPAFVQIEKIFQVNNTDARK